MPGHDLRLLSMALKAGPKRDVAAFGDAPVESLGGFGKFPLVHQGRPERSKRKAVLFAASLRRNCQQSLGQPKRAFELAAVIKVVPEPAGADENGFVVAQSLRKPPRLEVIALDLVRGVAAGGEQRGPHRQAEGERPRIALVAPRQVGDQVQAVGVAEDSLLIGEAPHRAGPGAAPPFDRNVGQAGLGEVMRHNVRLVLGALRKPVS